MTEEPVRNLPATRKADGIILQVRLTPKSRGARIDGDGFYGGKPILKAYVTAPPEDGKANAALVELIARAFSIPKSRVLVISGQKSRLKSLAIRGDPNTLLNKLARFFNNARTQHPNLKENGEDYD